MRVEGGLSDSRRNHGHAIAAAGGADSDKYHDAKVEGIRY